MSQSIRNRLALIFAGLWMGLCPAWAQSPAVSTVPDFSLSVKAFPHIWKPYQAQMLASVALSNGAPLDVRDGRVSLSLEQVLNAVIENNLTVANARYYSAEAQT